jgi:hypothetical protein
MVKIRTLVPLTHPSTGEQFGAGTEVDVADDVAAGWRADGKVSMIADEEAAAEAANTGVYDARTGREDTVQTKPSSSSKDKKS